MTHRLSALLLLALMAAPAAAASDPLRSDQWALSVIGAPQAWGSASGRGIVIAVVDTGVDLQHEDLKGKIVTGRDFVDGGKPQDRHGHGTHVAGIAAAVTGNGRGIAGVAPRAKIMPVRVLGADGTGRPSDVARGIRWAADNGAHVINLSLGDLGQPLFGPAFGEALRYAWGRGVICVVSAGNDFLLWSGYDREPAIVVSATDRGDRKPDYSSGVGSARWGMAAPGGAGSTFGSSKDDILSTYWRSGRRNAYAYLAGTSMAAPHVSGAAAMLRSLGLTPQQTVDRLLSTARDIGSPGRDSTFGHGRLDLAAAVRGLGSGGRGAAPGGGGAVATGPGAPGAAERPAGSPAPAGPASTDALDEPVTLDPGPPPDTIEPGAETGEGVPMAPFVVGVVTLLIAALLGWAMFRPNPPGSPDPD